MANWFHRFFNPHCEHCAEEKLALKHCDACDVLAGEISRIRSENERLLERILNPPKEDERVTAPQPQAILPKQIPWAVRRQMLESEDREKAKAMRNAAKPDTSVEELEKEMGVAEKERENAAK